MSIPFTGTHTRSHGVISAIIKQLKTINLKPVQSINIKFDPFHDKALEIRDFLFHITTPKIIATNPRCNVKLQIASDLSEPIVTFNLSSGDKIVCKSENLTSLNILELCNKHITSLVPKEVDPELESKLQTKRKKGRIIIKPGSKHRGVFL
ncbi:mitochondrial ribosomal protein L53 [Xylocopa sonorina]|uniref:mitochondrial ribosomal protein L53 n=1 Tax=Xylocopa sonorina TaxID=1818115 RepID=UPI00403AD798